MTANGAITFGDLVGKLDVLHVTCTKCGRAGRYPVAALVARYGADAGLPDWKANITSDCPERTKPGLWNLCGAHFPDLSAALYGSARKGGSGV